MTFYVRDNFERFGNYISINIMHLSICNAKFFYYIAPVIKNGIRKINCECEGFIISETHDAYIFVLDSFFKMCPHRKKQFYVIYSNEFMTKSIIDSMGIYETFLFLIISI